MKNINERRFMISITPEAHRYIAQLKHEYTMRDEVATMGDIINEIIKIHEAYRKEHSED